MRNPLENRTKRVFIDIEYQHKADLKRRLLKMINKICAGVEGEVTTRKYMHIECENSFKQWYVNKRDFKEEKINQENYIVVKSRL